MTALGSRRGERLVAVAFVLAKQFSDDLSLVGVQARILQHFLQISVQSVGVDRSGYIVVWVKEDRIGWTRFSAGRYVWQRTGTIGDRAAMAVVDGLRADVRGAAHGARRRTRLERATCGTIRLQLLKIGALVTVSVRRVKVAFASACPSRDTFVLAQHRLCA